MNPLATALLVILPALGTLPLHAQTEPGRRLELVEVAARPLPDTVVITTVAAAPSGMAVLLFRGQPTVTRLGQQGLSAEVHSLRLRNPVGIALLPGDSLVEAVDTAGSRVRRVRLAPGGRLLAERRYRVPLTPSNAVRGDDGWYVGGADTAGAYRVYHLDDAGDGVAAVGVVPAGDVQMVAHLTVCGGEVVVSQRTFPFRATRLAPGRAPRDLEPVAPPVAASDSAAMERLYWQSAPTVCLGSGYLRTLSDLRSDRRVLLMYGADGRVARTLTLDVPLAVVASVPGRDALLAVRRIGAPELVWYDWRWSGTNPETGSAP